MDRSDLFSSVFDLFPIIHWRKLQKALLPQQEPSWYQLQTLRLLIEA